MPVPHDVLKALIQSAQKREIKIIEVKVYKDFKEVIEEVITTVSKDIPIDLAKKLEAFRHKKEEEVGDKEKKVEEKAKQEEAKEKQEEQGDIVIEGFNFYELGPVLRNINFNGVILRDCSFAQVKLVDCALDQSACERVDFEGAERKTAAEEQREAMAWQKEPESHAELFAPTPWQKLMLARSPQKLFSFSLIPRYVELDEVKEVEDEDKEVDTVINKSLGICHTQGNTEWKGSEKEEALKTVFYNFFNVETMPPEAQHFGWKMHLSIPVDRLEEALEEIGYDLFQLGHFKVEEPELLKAGLRHAEQLKTQRDQELKQREQKEAKETLEALKIMFDAAIDAKERSVPFTIYLHEYPDGTPAIPPKKLLQAMQRIEAKLKAKGIVADKILRPQSDMLTIVGPFSMRMDRDLFQKPLDSKVVGTNSNSINAPCPYTILLSPKPRPSSSMFGWFGSSAPTFGTFKPMEHFAKFPQSSFNCMRNMRLTVQACIAEYANVNRIWEVCSQGAPSRLVGREDEFCSLSQDCLKETCKQNKSQQYRVEFLLRFLDFLNRNGNLANLSLDISVIKDPDIRALSSEFEKRRKQFFPDTKDEKSTERLSSNADINQFFGEKIAKRIECLVFSAKEAEEKVARGKLDEVNHLIDLIDEKTKAGQELLSQVAVFLNAVINDDVVPELGLSLLQKLADKDIPRAHVFLGMIYDPEISKEVYGQKLFRLKSDSKAKKHADMADKLEDRQRHAFDPRKQ